MSSKEDGVRTTGVIDIAGTGEVCLVQSSSVSRGPSDHRHSLVYSALNSPLAFQRYDREAYIRHSSLGKEALDCLSHHIRKLRTRARWFTNQPRSGSVVEPNKSVTEFVDSRIEHLGRKPDVLLADDLVPPEQKLRTIRVHQTPRLA